MKQSQELSNLESSDEDYLDSIFGFDDHALENLSDDLIVIADRVIRQCFEDQEDFVESGFCVFTLLQLRVFCAYPLSFTSFELMGLNKPNFFAPALGGRGKGTRKVCDRSGHKRCHIFSLGAVAAVENMVAK